MDNSNPFTKALLLRRLIQYFLTHQFVGKRQIVAWIRKKISISKVHDRSPFCFVFLSLLERARVNSAVYLSIPYLTDKYVIVQLFRNTDTKHDRSLQI